MSKRMRFQRISGGLLHWSGKGLVIAVWGSSLLFGLYILAFYAAALYGGHPEDWNSILPGLHHPDESAATVGIGAHFAAGGIILILGCIQLLEGIRRRFPVVHRWLGRLYVLSCVVAGVGGLTFILAKGTIGGWVMDIGFGLYGLLMLLCAAQAWRHAAAGRIGKHRAWALRLFALAIGSWLYRMEYGFWFMLADAAGHTDDFRGWFDRIMAFFFYLPNLLVAEMFIRKETSSPHPVLSLLAALLILAACLFICVGTYFFTLHYWGPAIVAWARG